MQVIAPNIDSFGDRTCDRTCSRGTGNGLRADQGHIGRKLLRRIRKNLLHGGVKRNRNLPQCLSRQQNDKNDINVYPYVCATTLVHQSRAEKNTNQTVLELSDSFETVPQPDN